MANYFITIRKTEVNPNYKEEVEKYQQENRYYDRGPNRDLGAPLPEIVKDVLICELTEEQYKKVKLEALKSFE